MIIKSLQHFYTVESKHFQAKELYDRDLFPSEEELIFKPMLDFAEALREELGRT